MPELYYVCKELCYWGLLTWKEEKTFECSNGWKVEDYQEMV